MNKNNTSLYFPEMLDTHTLNFIKTMVAALIFSYSPEIQIIYTSFSSLLGIYLFIPGWFLEVLNDFKVLTGFALSFLAILLGIYKIIEVRANIKKIKSGEDAKDNGK